MKGNSLGRLHMTKVIAPLVSIGCVANVVVMVLHGDLCVCEAFVCSLFVSVQYMRCV